jgi:hypothetical protein
MPQNVQGQATQRGSSEQEFLVPLSPPPQGRWPAEFQTQWDRGQQRRATVSTAVVGCRATVVQSQIHVTVWSAVRSFEIDVRPFVNDCIDYANANS